jgi:hypothetical protein
VVLDVSKSGTVALQFQATGLSLRSTDKMLLRVVALPSNTPKSQVLSECVRGVNGGADSDGTATVLFWGEAGPDAKGSVSTGITVEVPRSQYAYACGYAVLTAHGENVDAKSSRRLAAIIDLSTAYATHAVN